MCDNAMLSPDKMRPWNAARCKEGQLVILYHLWPKARKEEEVLVRIDYIEVDDWNEMRCDTKILQPEDDPGTHLTLYCPKEDLVTYKEPVLEKNGQKAQITEAVEVGSVRCITELRGPSLER